MPKIYGVDASGRSKTATIIHTIHDDCGFILNFLDKEIGPIERYGTRNLTRILLTQEQIKYEECHWLNDSICSSLVPEYFDVRGRCIKESTIEMINVFGLEEFNSDYYEDLLYGVCIMNKELASKLKESEHLRLLDEELYASTKQFIEDCKALTGVGGDGSSTKNK